MSNDLTGQIWAVDTAFSAGEIAAHKGPIRVMRMEWNPAAAANDLTIIDNSSHIIWDVDAIAAAPAGKEVYDQSEGIVFNGINVSVIDGGTLYITIR